MQPSDSPICLAIFLILKIGSPNIDSPVIALRKITGDWGLFRWNAASRHTRGAMLSTSDKKMGDGVMKRLFLLGVIALLAIAASGRAMAADAFGAWTNGLPTAWVEGPTCDPYVDLQLHAEQGGDGTQVGRQRSVRSVCQLQVSRHLSRRQSGGPLFPLLRARMGQGRRRLPTRRRRPGGAPTPLGRRRRNPSPPMPFTEWPYGGTAEYWHHPAEFGR